MIKNEIILNQDGCKNCSRSFRHGDLVYLFKKDELQCCSTCASDLAIESFDDQEDEPFDFYVVDNDVGRRVFDEASFLELDEGYYELRKINNSLAIQSEIKANCFNKVYSSEADDSTFFLIKDNRLASLLFPKQKYLDKYDFIETPDIYKNEISKLLSYTNVSDFGYICSSKDMIVGISAIKNHAVSFSRNKSSECSTLNRLDLQLKDINKLIAECRNMSIDRKTAKQLKTFTPEKMLRYFEKRIQGQGKELKKAVYIVYKYLQSVAKGEPFYADNWILTGISGSGKTEFFRVLRDFLKLYDIPAPVVQIDLSNITETGFKGAEPNSIPQRIIQENPNTKGVGICFLDEADKKCVASYGSHNVNINAAIQSNLLTLIEGRKVVDDEMSDFDSGLTMFVFMGAFQELRNRKRIAKRKNANIRSIGFAANFVQPDKSEVFPNDAQDELTLQDMIEYGLMEELAGRMVQVINFHKLSEKDMLKLIKCKVQEISKAMEIKIEITNKAANDFLSISFGGMGVRCPMNKIKELTQNKIAEVFFDNGFDPTTDKVIIDSLNSARIKHMRTNENEAS